MYLVAYLLYLVSCIFFLSFCILCLVLYILYVVFCFLSVISCILYPASHTSNFMSYKFNSLLYNIADAKIDRMQKVQNQAARILTRSPRRDHITPVLKQLHWLEVRERIRYKVLILAHKSFYETAPQYLSAVVTRKDYVKNTRSSTEHYLLCTPPLSKDCSNTFLERSFIFSAPREWNSLDESIRKSDFNMFMKSVETELLGQYYEC